MAKGRAEQRRARAGAQILMGTADLTMKPSAPRPLCAGEGWWAEASVSCWPLTPPTALGPPTAPGHVASWSKSPRRCLQAARQALEGLSAGQTSSGTNSERPGRPQEAPSPTAIPAACQTHDCFAEVVTMLPAIDPQLMLLTGRPGLLGDEALPGRL